MDLGMYCRIGRDKGPVLRFAELLKERLVKRVAQTKPMGPEGIKVGLDGGDDPLKFRFTKNAQASQERNP